MFVVIFQRQDGSIFVADHVYGSQKNAIRYGMGKNWKVVSASGESAMCTGNDAVLPFAFAVSIENLVDCTVESLKFLVSS